MTQQCSSGIWGGVTALVFIYAVVFSLPNRIRESNQRVFERNNPEVRTKAWKDKWKEWEQRRKAEALIQNEWDS